MPQGHIYIVPLMSTSLVANLSTQVLMSIFIVCFVVIFKPLQVTKQTLKLYIETQETMGESDR